MYRKPTNISYTDMCIYIDTHIYDDYDENLVFEYLYHIVKMLATKGGYFSNYKEYDDFAIYGASSLFLRLTTQKDLPRVKSILNYAKKVVYPLKVDFMNSEYSPIPKVPENADELTYNFDNVISRQVSSLNLSDFGMTMMDVKSTCRKLLSTIPYDMNSSEWSNIYVSVMLSFLNSVTLRNRSIRRLEHLEDTHFIREYHLDNFYENEREEEPILFHLPSHMSNYISVLSRQLRSMIAKDLSDILRTKVHSDYVLIESERSNFIKENSSDDNTE